ncbi:MAG: priA [Crocinitomicaceae bacterium]|jgi:primosomal protein N' (replication factor Y)|nr:priA [Crocinitomicaceae bacterium]
MNERKTLFVDVIVPLAVKNEFSYRVPFEMNDFIKSGMRVVVPFGKSKLYTAIVTKVHEQAPSAYQAKYIEYLLDDYPIVTGKQYQFWKWISSYYMAPIGDVMNAALPSNFKLASETKVALHPDFDGNTEKLSDRQFQVVEALEVNDVLDLKEISDIIGIKTVQPLIKELIDLHVIISQEELSYKYVAKTGIFYRFSEAYQDEETLNELIDRFEKQKQKEKQFAAIMALLQHTKTTDFAGSFVAKKALVELEISQSALNSLEKGGIIEAQRLQIDRFQDSGKDLQERKSLSDFQQAALDEIRAVFREKDHCLLHGITGSGKTEVYVELIEEQIRQGKQVLFLLPEIALTTQLIQRLSAYFGDLIGVYHSRFNQNERVEIWNHVLTNHPERFRIILGARSSIFLPYQDLGLVIIDEEHESSFKQYDPSPRYNARDASLVLAKSFGAKVLLGSATPAIESYYNAKSGKFGLVEMTKRFGGIMLPEVLVADVKKETKQKTMQEHFSSMLIESIKEALEKDEQVILFQNRRGFTPLWTCEVCAWVPKCKSCDVSLTYHKHSNSLKCHYCGYTSPPVGTCHSCGSNRLKMLGFGTEKVEDDLSLLFPGITIARMDLDSTRSKNAYQNIISDFENKKINILIGTQMVTKGLDFDNVSLVGVLDADMMLRRPDFRAFERSFQLMTQVAGRAGRKLKRGKVIIQTREPENWIIQKVIEHNYTDFYENEILERKNFFYPPFYKVIRFTLKAKNENELNAAAKIFAELLYGVFKERVLGPEFPVIQKINNFYLKQVTLKIEREVSPQKVKERLEELIDIFFSTPSNKSVRLVTDVDPA